MKINTALIEVCGRATECCHTFIPSSFQPSQPLTLEKTLFDPFGWSCIDSLKQTSSAVYTHGALRDRNLYSTVKESQREPCSSTTTLPRPLQQSGRKVMSSFRQAVEGNNKNNLKWWVIHYSLSSGMASPLFPPFPLLFTKASQKVCAAWLWLLSVQCRTLLLIFLLSYLFWAAFIEKLKFECKEWMNTDSKDKIYNMLTLLTHLKNNLTFPCWLGANKMNFKSPCLTLPPHTETMPQVFGIPLSQVISNDRAHKQRHDPPREEHSDPTELMLSFLQLTSSFKRANKELSSSTSSLSSTSETPNESPLPSTPDAVPRTRRRVGSSVNSLDRLL